MKNFIVAIPARLASQRLPGKLLKPLNGKPLIHHTVDRAIESGAQSVIVATDAEVIAESVTGLPCEICMTAGSHRSGTDRLAECAERMRWPDETIVVNLQGDEPLVSGKWLRQLALDLAADNTAAIATLCHPIDARAEIFDPNVVKVVLSEQGYALYFSRAPIPWDRASFSQAGDELTSGTGWYRHVGVYAYRASALRAFGKLQATPAELRESLEQLRALEHGYSIHVRIVEDRMPPGIDTESDMEQVALILQQETSL